MESWRPSRFVAVAILLAVPTTVVNCNRVVFGVANVPAYIGSYERRAAIRYGAGPRQSLDVYVSAGGARRPVVAVELDRKLRAAGVLVECHVYAPSTHFDTVAAKAGVLRGPIASNVIAGLRSDWRVT